MPEKSSRQENQRTAAMPGESKAQNLGTKASGQSQKPKLKLEGSCHCQAIKFSLMSSTPCPYTVCFCGFCRKLTGGSGGATFITGDASTFQAEGTEHLGIYRARVEPDPGQVTSAEGWRHFCKLCGSHLWTWAPSSPGDINPVASAIDTPLPRDLPERQYIFMKDKAPWVYAPPENEHHKHFDKFPPEDPVAWHKRHGLYHE